MKKQPFHLHIGWVAASLPPKETQTVLIEKVRLLLVEHGFIENDEFDAARYHRGISPYNSRMPLFLVKEIPYAGKE